MEANVTDVDDAIAEYRRQIQTEAELAENDLDELEEHLRELTDELRATGMSSAEAVTEAARRLGDPRQLAREHVRVRSPFGVPLSAGRAWSAAVLFVLPLIGATLTFLHLDGASGPPVPSRAWLYLGAFGFVAIALAARRTWARAVVLGIEMQVLALLALSVLRLPIDLPFMVRTIWELGIVAFVMPWRRQEFSPTTVTLALQSWACVSAMSFAKSNSLFVETSETVALVCAAAACVGIVRRARWSAIASALSALALVGALGDLFMPTLTGGYAPELQLYPYGSGAIAATIAAILGWRSTRSRVRTLQPAVR